ncbi:MAG: Uma2 family endonuclease [Pirellulaceae bacterium]|jgi:Uma2 family endonuclease|nr:Uma2 family endonuclease [Pirellulaceae bacterium]
MSAVPQATIWISPDDYLTGELAADVRHEYVGGRVFAMAGASADHNRICINLVSGLGQFVEGHPCEAFSNDMKIRTHREVFYYPDVMVCCDPADNARYYRERPRFVFEVLSDETRKTDEREKSLAYFHTPSVEAYILIEQAKMQVTVFRRDGGTWWAVEVLTQPGDTVRLDSLGFEISLERIYRRTEAAVLA